jgi:hypothetical protein
LFKYHPVYSLIIDDILGAGYCLQDRFQNIRQIRPLYKDASFVIRNACHPPKVIIFNPRHYQAIADARSNRKSWRAAIRNHPSLFLAVRASPS